ncbi:unnamed protein product [Larinioides sclopetarius]|uniref:Uncharacterized protein n=1 Tax=Larinioides sclopetarius TaxID=280406 RepID=A0AAV1ZSN2_9ARAC
MDNIGQIGVEDTFEFKFARDLIRYVVERRMEGLNWIPTGIFEKTNLSECLDSPFTPQMKKAVNKKLNLYENLYHRQYDSYFADERITEKSHKKICRELAEIILGKEFNVKNFFTFCVILAKYAGYSYLYGVRSSAEDACKTIIDIIRSMKAKSIITDSFWTEMQNFAENPDLTDDPQEYFSESESTETADEFE